MNKIEQFIYELYEIKNKSKRIQDEYKIRIKYLEKNIDKLLEKKKQSSYSFNCFEGDTEKTVYFKATSVKPKKIEWNVEMLQQILDKSIFNKICNKKYSIIDYDGFSGYLKTLNADPKIIKSFIQCEKTINQKSLDQLSELGEISVDDLEGCYTVINKEQYVRITRSEEEISDEE